MRGVENMDTDTDEQIEEVEKEDKDTIVRQDITDPETSQVNAGHVVKVEVKDEQVDEAYETQTPAMAAYEHAKDEPQPETTETPIQNRCNRETFQAPLRYLEDDSDLDEAISSELSESSDEEPSTSCAGLLVLCPDRVMGQGGSAGAAFPTRLPNGSRWKTEAEPDNGAPQPPRFTPKRTPGVQPPLNAGKPPPREIFSHFFDSELLQVLCENTNKNAAKNLWKGKKFSWTELAAEEMKRYLGMLMYMSVLDLPKVTDFWRRKNIFHVPFPVTVMARDRFVAISANFHMSDPTEDEENEKKMGTDGYDPLQQVRPLLELMRIRCMNVYHPKQHISVDERMVATQARLSLKHYMKDKPAKCGLKFFVLTDVNGYTVDFRLYAGKSKFVSGLSFDVVSGLVDKDFLGSGYVVYVDSFYTSPLLFRHLGQQGFGACGTYKQGRVGVPTTQINALNRRSPKGSVRWIRDRDLLFVKWMGTREVSLCTNVHPLYRIDGTQQKNRFTRPTAVSEYNKYMGGVDAYDQRLGTNSVHRKTRRWYIMAFQHVLDIAVTNSYVIHTELCASEQQTQMSRQAFQEELCAHLLGVPLEGWPQDTPTHDHFPVPTNNGEPTKTAEKRRRCNVCKQSTPWKCEACDMALCLIPKRNCFRQYHKKPASRPWTDTNGPPLETDTYGPPLETDTNGPPLETDTYGPPLETDTNGPPLETDTYGPRPEANGARESDNETEQLSEMRPSQTVEQGRELQPRKKRKAAGAATYGTKFKAQWTEEWPFITAGTTPFHFWCATCRHELECRHQGRADVVRHLNRQSHRRKLKMVDGSNKMDNCAGAKARSSEMAQLEMQTRRAEVKVAVTMVQHNIPLAFADHLSPLFKECFPDSQIAQKYASARTKTTAIINKCVAPILMNELVSILREQPFSLATDGTNDTGREKMNPLTVILWSSHGVIQRFLDMGLSSSCRTAKAIFSKMAEVLDGHEIPWTNCVGLAVDNASVNLGIRNSIKSRVLSLNPSIYVLGCPCHIVHNSAHAGGEVYTKISGFDVEDVCVDLAYWFKSSTDRRNMLTEFCALTDADYMEVLQRSNVRWLSLELAVNRILRLYSALKRHFRSADETQARGARLRARFEDPLTEVHLLLYQALLPTFSQFNLLFQRPYPCVHLLHDQVRTFIRKLMSKFLKPAVVRTADLESVDLQDQENQLPDHQLGIGLTIKAALRRLHEAGDVPLTDVDQFHAAARGFLVRATQHALEKLPLNDPLLPHAAFVDFRQRQDMRVEDVLYFVQRYSHLLPFGDPRDQDKIAEEFLDYQMLEEADLPDSVWESALVKVGEADQFHRMDIVWAHLTTRKNPITGQQQFPRLSKVAQLVFCLPHSNGDAERVFSTIGLNKTDARNRLAVDGTLASIMCIKGSQMEPCCYKYEPSVDMIKKSKSATSSSCKPNKTRRLVLPDPEETHS